jgi:heme exporter protein A
MKLDLEQVAVALSGRRIVEEISLAVESGTIVGLIGPNGSGKSTLLRLLAGLTRPTSGTILIGGWELPNEAAAVRAQIGLVSHKSLLYENLTARENLRFFARLYNLKSADERIDTLLRQVGLFKRGDSLVRTFSRGMQQRLSIARALLHEPDVLLFDEPYTGLDVDASQRLDDLLLQARADGHTILMTTHELDRAARIASRVLILNRGAVGYDAPASSLDANELATRYTELTGTAA